jgi:hypothetical protein
MDSFNTSLSGAPSREARIQAVLSEQRALAHDALDDLMHEAFLEIGVILSSQTDNPGAPNTLPDKPVSGLSTKTLQLIRQHHDTGDLAEWLSADAGGNKSIIISQFLNLSALQMQELRARFPRAFMKWEEGEDAALLSAYQEETAQGRKANFNRLAERFGRNANALRLRLEHLGIDLGDEAGVSRRSGRIR